MTGRILFLRHAESEWNALGRWQGQADPPLSSRGRRQVSRLAERHPAAWSSLALVASSDLCRATHTARALVDRIGVPLEIRADLRERHVGDWAGATRAEVEADWPELAAAVFRGELDVRPPGGETRRELRARVVRALGELRERSRERPFAVVSHLGVLRALLPGTRLDNARALWLELEIAGDIAMARARAEPV